VDVDRTECGGEGVDGFRVSEVEGAVFDTVELLGECGRVAAGADNPIPALGEECGDGAADARRCARNERRALRHAQTLTPGHAARE